MATCPCYVVILAELVVFWPYLVFIDAVLVAIAAF